MEITKFGKIGGCHNPVRDQLIVLLIILVNFYKEDKMNNGKTAQETLIEQLAILDQQINKIVMSVNQKDADALF